MRALEPISQRIQAAVFTSVASQVISFSVFGSQAHWLKSSSPQNPLKPHRRVTTLPGVPASPHGRVCELLWFWTPHMPSSVHWQSWPIGSSHCP